MPWQTTLQSINETWRVLRTTVSSPADIKASRMVESVLAEAVVVANNNIYVFCIHDDVQGHHEDGLDCWCSPELVVFGATPGFEEA